MKAGRAVARLTLTAACLPTLWLGCGPPPEAATAEPACRGDQRCLSACASDPPQPGLDCSTEKLRVALRGDRKDPPAEEQAEGGSRPLPAPSAARPSALESTSRGPTLDAVALVERCKPSIVTIRRGDSLGTGFAVAAGGYIATNVHVIRGTGAIEVETADKLRHPVRELTAFDVRRDAAIMRIEGASPEPLRLSRVGSLQVGERVFALGHPLGLDLTVSDGLLSAMPGTRPGALLQISAPISPGSSGGPVLNGSGAVIGIATATAGRGQNVNFAVPAEVLLQLLAAPTPTTIGRFDAAVRELGD